MAPSRTRQIDSDGPSTGDVSMNEDTDVNDQNGTSNGVAKFTVSLEPAAVPTEISPRRKDA